MTGVLTSVGKETDKVKAGSVRLMIARTHSRRLAVDTHEQNVLKLTLEPSLAKPEVQGLGTS